MIQSSPRISGSPRHSTMSAAAPPPCSASSAPPPRENYQNASTQYSPMGGVSQNSPAAANKSSATAPEQGPTQSDTSAPRQPTPAKTQAQREPQSARQPNHPVPPSPKTKRRQFKETTESDHSTGTAQASSPKRTKPAKSAAKVLTARYELCAVEDIVILIADMISELIETNDNLPLRDVVLTRFHSRLGSCSTCTVIAH